MRLLLILIILNGVSAEIGIRGPKNGCGLYDSTPTSWGHNDTDSALGWIQANACDREEYLLLERQSEGNTIWLIARVNVHTDLSVNFNETQNQMFVKYIS